MSLVLYEAEGRIAVITMNRPESRNAMSPELSAALGEAFDRFDADDDLWVAILAGNGRVFCAGADLKALSEGRAAGIITAEEGFGRFARRQRDKPVIAAVDRPAVAGGFELVLGCDLVVASTEAAFGLPEVKRSLVASEGGVTRLPRRIPPNIAMELALTGDTIDVHRAHALGLVNVICEPGQALAEAKMLAERIVANAPLAVRAIRHSVLDGLETTEAEGFAIAARYGREISQTEDFLEGPRAFVEKRPPVWKGR
ncbi:MAG: crotonase/enoyl-CoA hydratase family protein [Acidimicrobiia bacterium]|nr:crotonase/enoyl-CoA hydratase family protein [Acidimicrobiia bacterium]MYE71649.1 crotonase/enoyl-CoA hydratase family protein [Acidimicrobiia bacterium]MYJ63523.1 crotonase/enoyl-CoA hydratase family protein [Acidimicrobiia bacterium]